MRNKRLRAGLMLPIVAALVLVASAPTAFADPITVCTYLFADSTHGSITLPTTSPETQCTAALPSGKNLRFDMDVACASTSLLATTLTMQFNGDTGSNYVGQQIDSFLTTQSLAFNTVTGTNIVVAQVGCRASSELPNAATAIRLRIPDAFSNFFDKTAIIRSTDVVENMAGGNTVDVGAYAGTWFKSTPTPISSVTFTMPGSTFLKDSRIDVFEDN